MYACRRGQIIVFAYDAAGVVVAGDAGAAWGNVCGVISRGLRSPRRCLHSRRGR